MVIVVMALLAILFAERIQNRIIGGRYLVYDAFVYKCLQGTVNRNPVKRNIRIFFYIGMCQCTF